MLSPKRVKFRKRQRGRLKGTDERGSSVSFGEFGLKAVTSGRLTARQIEAARITINRQVKRGGKLWIRIFPHTPITKKPAETRMGKGKGNPEFWIAEIRPGRILFEMSGIDEETAEKALSLASYKLPIHTEFVKRSAL
ncbi:50S ribosomal protein L16 [Leptospira borgpetersenii]|uniref:Large ribosomal subunit protein uL16 n=4 Tax=Pseudomonadati TaxID=3379134 RepID=RL16_LEPBJ|nr:50S ribosomal protein L16 [Leptospira borgpetersenii]Q04PU5.1 RecName: Full=Large ribosomal subunit protein uL16; AltName: Full=50S ribosomal protein L16 [Leptospira borgpetersenii serovar Hardjo-bovis str. JB197]Q055D7.1 RecName: Full=Large ribosomal subunit protein uL16; AltName: Full=50S ribosomal protein L16 [Leptospira borgpetersenii serovar Hardjo-bovis str. L550]ABJ77075.1 50S Ribosomal protein L16 [Leptospira borgpetersenii serovar Hardjo-bovis str. JB197]ABJ78018.1 50S Ribosomal pro